MDADDLMFPDRLYRQLDFMESHPDIDMISSCYIGFGDDCYSYLPKTQKVTLEMQLKNNCLSQPTAMIRTESFKGLDGPYRHGYDRAEDYEL
jgi:hypothetical protein